MRRLSLVVFPILSWLLPAAVANLPAWAFGGDGELDAARLPPPGAKIASLGKGFIPLFDGVSFSGWKYRSEYPGHWVVREGAIYCDGQVKRVQGDAGDLWTAREYANFILLVDWRLPGAPQLRELPTFAPDGLYVRDAKGKIVLRPILDGGDSGVYLRGSSRYQANIWSQPMGSGDINDLHKDVSLPVEIRRACVPRKRADKPFGQWNRFMITMRGDRVTVVLNGERVIDNALLPGVAPRGRIALQNHGDPVEFCNLFLREMP